LSIYDCGVGVDIYFERGVPATIHGQLITYTEYELNELCDKINDIVNKYNLELNYEKECKYLIAREMKIRKKIKSKIASQGDAEQLYNIVNDFERALKEISEINYLGIDFTKIRKL